MARIKGWRNSVGVAQKDLADILGCNRSSLAMTENNSRNLKKEYDDKIKIIESHDCTDAKNTRQNGRQAIAVENTDLIAKLKKYKLKLRQLVVAIRPTMLKLKSMTALIRLLDALQDEPLISETLEYRIKRRNALPKYEKLITKKRNMEIEMAALKAAIKKMESYLK
jgi:transcriptional regulator with XRE-family HTH domain